MSGLFVELNIVVPTLLGDKSGYAKVHPTMPPCKKTLGGGVVSLYYYYFIFFKFFDWLDTFQLT